MQAENYLETPSLNAHTFIDIQLTFKFVIIKICNSNLNLDGLSLQNAYRI